MGTGVGGMESCRRTAQERGLPRARSAKGRKLPTAAAAQGRELPNGGTNSEKPSLPYAVSACAVGALRVGAVRGWCRASLVPVAVSLY